MKFTIITLDNSRDAYKEQLRRRNLYPEVILPAVDARGLSREGIQSLLDDRGLEIDLKCWPNPKNGEIGVWLSNYDRWQWIAKQDEPVIVFEDDAIIDEDFMYDFNRFYQDLPEDWDFAALWVPENQTFDYRYNATYENGAPRIHGGRPDHEPSQYDFGVEHAALVYQGYGMVSLMYSPKGAQSLVEIASRGITGPVDCWIYEHAEGRGKANLKGFAPKPQYATIVRYDWSAQSHVQHTEMTLF